MPHPNQRAESKARIWKFRCPLTVAASRAVFCHSDSVTHPGSHGDVWASSASPGPLQTLPAGQGWHCPSAPRPTALDRDPGGHGTGCPVPRGQKCPTGQMSLPGRAAPEDSTWMRKIQGESVVRRGFGTVCTERERGAAGQGTQGLSPTNLLPLQLNRDHWHKKGPGF